MSLADRLWSLFRPRPSDAAPAAARDPEIAVVPQGPMTSGVPPVAPVNDPAADGAVTNDDA